MNEDHTKSNSIVSFYKSIKLNMYIINVDMMYIMKTAYKQYHPKLDISVLF